MRMAKMRFIIRAQIPTDAGNQMVQNPNMIKDIEDYINKTKAEAAYFFEAGGERTLVFIVDMSSADMMPAIAEPLFQKFNAKVEFHPVMVLEDLKKAIGKLGKR
jgi:hypothetical protein